MNSCEGSRKCTNSKNTTQQMTTDIWRISAGLSIPLYPEFTEEQTKFNEDRKPQKMNTYICWSKDLIHCMTRENNETHERSANNMNKVPEI